MDVLEATQINSFAHKAQQTEVSPVEESVFVLTSTQLQEIISRAVLEAIEPLHRELALDRQRIAKLEQREPQPLQKDRGEILRALIATNGGKMLAKEARQKMRLDKVLFSQLLSKVEDIEIRPYNLDKRQKLLVLR
jgi:cytoskeletal protein RodZ